MCVWECVYILFWNFFERMCILVNLRPQFVCQRESCGCSVVLPVDVSTIGTHPVWCCQAFKGSRLSRYCQGRLMTNYLFVFSPRGYPSPVFTSPIAKLNPRVTLETSVFWHLYKDGVPPVACRHYCPPLYKNGGWMQSVDLWSVSVESCRGWSGEKVFPG